MNQDRIVTALDILQEQETLEAEAKEALPYKFDQCTYDKGRLNQPIYVCLDCYKDEEADGGICYSCSIACHASHNLLELFNKRDFICECGTLDKYKQECTLSPNKPNLLQNEYNHNFKGLYCKCNTFYDPKDEEVVMFQCYFCYDWFHEDCVGEVFTMFEDYEDFICFDCVDKHKFLLNYYGNKLIRIEPAFDLVDLHKINPDCDQKDDFSSNHNFKNRTNSADNLVEKEEPVLGVESVKPKETMEEPKPQLYIEDIASKIGSYTDINDCKYTKSNNKSTIELNEINQKYNFFGFKSWTEALCQCEKCKDMYKTKKLEYLFDEEIYTPEKELDAKLEALKALPHTKAINMAQAYDKIKRKLVEFVEPYSKTDKVITSKDVHDFFKKAKFEFEDN